MNNTRALKYLSLGLCLGLQYIRLRCLLFWEYLEYLLFWNTFIWQCNKIFYLRFLYRYFKPVAILPSSTFYNLMEQAYSSIRSLYNYIPEFLEFSNSQLKHGLIFCCLGLLLPWPSPVYLPYCRGKACPLSRWTSSGWWLSEWRLFLPGSGNVTTHRTGHHKMEIFKTQVFSCE